MEWNNGRLTRPPEELLAFHQRKLGELTRLGWDGRVIAYHQERIDYLSQIATVHTLHTPQDQANVYRLDDYRGGNAA